MSDYYYQNRDSDRQSIREARKKKRRRQVMIRRAAFAVICIAVVVLLVVLCVKIFGGKSSSTSTESGNVTSSNKASSSNEEIMKKAETLAAGYDYDKAIETLQTIPDYADESDVTAKIEEYKLTRDKCVAVDISKTPHIFFHSLIVDFDRCFDTTTHPQNLIDGFNAWMITVEEFEKTIQQLYDLGYVVLNVSDMYTKDASGNYAMNTNLKLPEGKKPIVFSYDDTNYYCDYEGWGCADKLVLTDNGEIKNEYTDASGNTQTGNYDHISILIDFCKEHPDFAYHGHKGTMALTGYNGVFGYRTEPRMFTNSSASETAWLQRHTDITYDKIETYKAEAKKVAEALKENGYEFASHSWGHINCTSIGMDNLKKDTGWWVNNVESIVGDTDIIIYPHGADIAGTEDYTSSNEKYNYFKSQGFGVFCGVDGTNLYWNQFRDGYVRQSRIDMDGICMYREKTGTSTALGKLGLDVNKIWDSRRITPVKV